MTAGNALDDSATPRSAVLSRSALRWYVVAALGLGLAGAAAGYASAPLLPANYTTSSQIIFGSPPAISALGIQNSSGVLNSTSAAEILRSPDVFAEASRLVHGELTPGQVGKQTSINSTINSPVIVVAVTAATPELAQDLANAVPQAYLNVQSHSLSQRAGATAKALNQVLTDQQTKLADVQTQMASRQQAITAQAAGLQLKPNDQASYVQATLDTDIGYQLLRNQAAALTNKISETNDAIGQTTVDSSLLQTGIDRVVPADRPSSAAKTTQRRNAALGAGIGILLGGLLAWRRTEKRRTVNPASAAATLGAPLLGTVGRDRRLHRLPGFVDFAADDAFGNELKVLAASLVLSARRRGLSAVVVTSAHRREGKSVLTRNLAIAAEYTGQPVILVDAGFGRPTTTEILDLEGRPGLAEVVEGEQPARLIHHLEYEDGGRVPVLPIGRNGFATEPGRKLNEARRQHWAAALPEMRPLIPLVDAPAVSDHPLALQLATGGGLVVIASPRTTLTDLEVIRNRADVADVPVLGFILNGAWKYGTKSARRGRTPNFVVEPAPDTEPSVG